MVLAVTFSLNRKYQRELVEISAKETADKETHVFIGTPPAHAVDFPEGILRRSPSEQLSSAQNIHMKSREAMPCRSEGSLREGTLRVGEG